MNGALTAPMEADSAEEGLDANGRIVLELGAASDDVAAIGSSLGLPLPREGAAAVTVHAVAVPRPQKAHAKS